MVINMSNQKGSDSSDGNNSDSESNVEELSNTEANDSTENTPQNSAVVQSNGEDEEGSSDHSLSPDETSIFEIQELTSEDSLQKNNLDLLENLRVLYEFPDDVEENEVNQSAQQNKKRPYNGKNVHFAKKPKSEESNNEDNNNENLKTNGLSPKSDTSKYYCSDQGEEDAGVDSDNSMEKCTSSKNLPNPRRIAKPSHRLSKDQTYKKPTRIETDDKTGAFKSINVASSSSEGTLADVEDNADSKSKTDLDIAYEFKSVKAENATSECAFADIEDNVDSQGNADSQSDDDSQMDDEIESNERQSEDDVSNDNEKNVLEPISLKPVANHEGASSSKLFVPVVENPPLQNTTKTDKDNRAVSESNISPHTAGSKDAAISSATNEMKLKPGVGTTKKRRCLVCNKKLGLTAFECRCGGLYCSNHRYDKEHGCTFDYKSMGAEEIRKNNPQIVAEKVSKL